MQRYKAQVEHENDSSQHNQEKEVKACVIYSYIIRGEMVGNQAAPSRQ